MGNLKFDALLYVCNHRIAYFPSSRVRHWFYRKVMKLDLAPGVHIFSGLWVDCRGAIVIGQNSVVNQQCRLDNRGGLFIGSNVSISPQVHLITGDHDVQSPDFAGRTRPIHIGDRVFIGSRATILPGVTLGEGAVVAAGSVVVKDVPPFSIAAGVPAKVIGKRSENQTYNTLHHRYFL